MRIYALLVTEEGYAYEDEDSGDSVVVTIANGNNGTTNALKLKRGNIKSSKLSVKSLSDIMARQSNRAPKRPAIKASRLKKAQNSIQLNSKLRNAIIASQSKKTPRASQSTKAPQLSSKLKDAIKASQLSSQSKKAAQLSSQSTTTTKPATTGCGCSKN